jgi:hypothetical protein
VTLVVRHKVDADTGFATHVAITVVNVAADLLPILCGGDLIPFHAVAGVVHVQVNTGAESAAGVADAVVNGRAHVHVCVVTTWKTLHLKDQNLRLD